MNNKIQNRKIHEELEVIADKHGYPNASAMMDTLKVMREQDIRDISEEGLRDISEIKIDPSLPVINRLLSLLEQTKNPYCYRYNGIIIKVSFAGKQSLEDCLAVSLFSD